MHRRRGQTLTEYLLIIMFCGVLAIAALTALGAATGALFSGISFSINPGASPTPSGPPAPCLVSDVSLVLTQFPSPAPTP